MLLHVELIGNAGYEIFMITAYDHGSLCTDLSMIAFNTRAK